MRAKTGIPIACACALSVFLCADLGLKAQMNTTTSLPGAVPVSDSTNEVAVAVGKALLIDTARPISRVAVGLGDVAEASVITPTEIMVNGHAPGETSLIIWDNRGGRQFPVSRERSESLDRGWEAARPARQPGELPSSYERIHQTT